MKEKELVDNIIKNLLEHPEDWRNSNYTYDNKKSGIEIWNDNVFFICIYKPVKISLNMWSKIRLWRAIKQSKMLKLNKVITENVSKL